MALTNAERQKRYRALRNEKASEHQLLRDENDKLKTENQQLRNEIDVLREKLRAARNNSPQNSLSETLHSEEPSRPTKPRLKKWTKECQLYYVEDGKLKLLASPVTPEDLKSAGINIVTYQQIDKKYSKQCETLVDAKNAEHVAKYNEKVASWNAVCHTIQEEQLEMAL